MYADWIPYSADLYIFSEDQHLYFTYMNVFLQNQIWTSVFLQTRFLALLAWIF